MKRIAMFSIVLAAGSCLGSGQISSPPRDVLGAHLNYGRGCSACHAPHSGATANGEAKKADTATGTPALWGEDVTGLFTKTTGAKDDGGSAEAQPSQTSAETPDVAGVVACLSCHDGNLAERATMTNQTYEKLPPEYGKSTLVPTLLGDGSPFGELFSHHPVGLGVVIPCGGDDAWDCSSSEGVVNMNGVKSSQFVKNYGMFVKPGKYNDKPVVMCSTCHDPHVMNVVNVGLGTKSGLPKGHYSTMFFLRGPYNPSGKLQGNNQAAQFCRQCHAAQSNEMYGASVATVSQAGR